jgi:hypothetical protein
MRGIEEAMEMLWKNAASNLTMKDLDTLAEATEEAEDRARRLSKVVDGIACLVSADCQPERGYRAGMFQSEDSLVELLVNISSEIDTIKSLIRVGCEAREEADKRREPKP